MSKVLVRFVMRSKSGGNFGRYRVYKSRSSAARAIRALKKSPRVVRVLGSSKIFG